ncbi:MAG: cob(I)yrinic acid a,c-diamide adenosyltransferase [Clostridia bacterium]
MSGLLHMYVGDGKGKSTAALGLVLRAAGAGFRVLYCQFLKTEDSSELAALSCLPGVTVMKSAPTDGFLFFMDNASRARALSDTAARLEDVHTRMCSGEFDLVVLDEFLWLIDVVLNADDACEFIRSRAPKCELVLTGGHAPDELIELADYVSNIQKVKHPFDNDTAARVGIEF